MFYNPINNLKESMKVIMFSHATSASTSLSIFYIMHSKSAKAKCWAFPRVISPRRLPFFTLTLTLGSRCLCFWSVGECYCQNKSNSNHNWNSDKKNSVPCSGAYPRHHSICVLYENKKRKVKSAGSRCMKCRVPSSERSDKISYIPKVATPRK